MIKIEEGLWQSGLMIGAGERWAKARPEVIWQLTEDVPEYPRIEECQGVVKIVSPIEDDDRTTMSDEVFARLWSIAKFVAGRQVLTVCMAGQNRSGLASALILLARHGYSGKAAIKVVRAAAPPRNMYADDPTQRRPSVS